MEMEIQLSNKLPPYFKEELKKFNFTPIKNAKIKSNIACFRTDIGKTEYYIAPKKDPTEVNIWDHKKEPQHPVDIIIDFLTKDEDKLENTELKQFIPDILVLPELDIYTENEKYAFTLLAYSQIIDDIRYNRR